MYDYQDHDKKKIKEEVLFFLDKAEDDNSFLSELQEIVLSGGYDFMPEDVLEFCREPISVEWISQIAIDCAYYNLVSIGSAIKDYLIDNLCEAHATIPTEVNTMGGSMHGSSGG